MNAGTAERAGEPTDGRRPSVIGPLAVWLATQLVVLVVGAAGLRFGANYATSGDLESLRLMLAAQLVVGTLASAFLCRSAGQTLVTAATIWPFAIVAGYLSGSPIPSTCVAAAFVSVWALTLGVWQRATPTPLRPTVAASLSLFVLGGMITSYLSREFGEQAIDFGPISAVFQLIVDPARWQAALSPAVSLALALVVRRWHTSNRA